MSLLVWPGRPSLRKAIRSPSGDHEGCVSRTPWAVFVSWVNPLPSAFIAQISRSVVVSVPEPLTNAILLPSGDQAGSCSATVVAVSSLRPVPSAFITAISLLVVLPLMNAILLPSGDHAAGSSPLAGPGTL